MYNKVTSGAKEMNFQAIFSKYGITANDVEFIEARNGEGSIRVVIAQLQILENAQRGQTNFVTLVRPVGTQDRFADISLENASILANEAASITEMSPIKFTPASGAASRMFGFLDKFLSDPDNADYKKLTAFFKGLDQSSSNKFAFLTLLSDTLKFKKSLELQTAVKEVLDGLSS